MDPERVNFDVYPPKSLYEVRSRLTKLAKVLTMSKLLCNSDNNHLGNGLC